MKVKNSKQLIMVVVLLITNQLHAQKTFDVKRTTESEVKIDGFLNESFWQTAQKIPLGWETSPGNNLPSEVSTDLRIAFDDENLYFSFQAFDPNPKQIRAIINDRDKLDDNDFVSLFLDPFNDSRRAFSFSINPLGVQQDGVFDEQEGEVDTSWDAIWKSAGRITDEGYIVEAVIPFKSLRFPSTDDVQSWRFFAIRVYPRSLEKLLRSNPLDLGNSCTLCQGNLIAGLKGIKPGRNLELIPTLTTSRTDERQGFPEGDLSKGEYKTNVGFDVRWGITTDLTLNATINPDFSQVEADAAQLDINNRFALQFPEKRPFFLEGADFFNTPLPVFFSRTIVDPTFGAKVTGKVSKNAVGLLATKDRFNSLILPGFRNSNSTTIEDEVTTVVGRFRRDIGVNSNIGVMYTGREGTDYHNRLVSIDAFLRPSDPLTIRLQYTHSETRYPNPMATQFSQPSGDFGGNAISAFVNYSTRNWEIDGIFESRGSGFRADAGFVPQVDYRRYRFNVERAFWPEDGSWYNNITVSAGGFKRESINGELDQSGFWINPNFKGPWQSNIWLNPDINWQRYEGVTYEMVRLWGGFDIQPLGGLGFNGFFNIGPAVDFENGRKADNFQFKLETDIRIGRHIDMSINHRLLKLHLNGNKIFNANISQASLSYNFNVRTFLRVVLQYRYTGRNPGLFNDNTVNRVDQRVFAQVLLSYKLNPQSVIFLGYVDNHQGWTNRDFREQALTQLNQTLFFKIGYAWRP